MAQKVLVQLVDDLDGTESTDISTVTFGLDGVNYEIDLTDKNAERLRESISPYVVKARRTGGRINRGVGAVQTDKKAKDDRIRKVREWAAENGIQVAPRGRIPADVYNSFDKAMAAPEGPRTAKPRTAKKRATTSR